jgi:spore coat protein CotH
MPPPGPFVPGPSPRSVALYDESRLIDLYLAFPPGEFEKLLATNPLAGDARWVRCSVTFEGETFPDAACRRKGDPAAWPIEGKPAMLVRFNLVNKQARFRGLRRLNLEYFDGAAAPIRDRLAMWLMREAGLDASRANSVRVFKDGSYYGLYQNIEALDKELLEDHFGPLATGDLWEGGEELKTNEDHPNPARLYELQDLVEVEPLEGDHTAFYQRLDALIDVPQFLRLMAAETTLISDDNFSNGSSNFYYYDHPERGFMVLPWDYDTILTGETASAVSDPFEFWGTSPPNRMRQLMNRNPTWRVQYIDQVVDIRDRVLARMPARVDTLCAQVRGTLENDPTYTASIEDFDADCIRLKTRIGERIAALRTMLGR